MFDFYANWYSLIIIIEYLAIFLGSIGLIFIAMVSLRQIQKKKKIWYLGIFLIYSSLLELLIHFTGEDIYTYNLVFVVTLLPFLLMCYLSSHYLVKRPFKTKLEFVKTGHGKINKVTKQEMKDMKDELQSANIIAWSGSIGAAFLIVAWSAKVRFIHSKEWMMAQELTKTTDNLLGFGGFMFLISAFLIVIYFIVDVVLWNKRGKFPGLVFRPMILCLWQFLFLISI
ncbi:MULTISPECIES: hypothetical protein [Staphylococcus]|uniref:hypothetical protein n=1 Tax=Staphylococcus TaxID=1279 RepID=UPI00069DADAD|nr:MULTISPECIES: hypothetical protein [Staphylococcus]MBY6180070.1 hypothetical protein [Staphylococcaceae bacterium DP2N0-1]MCH4517731.1 hypothetical protein [Staphylococcus haemolyticus]MCH4534060.1 hypothetical protein [Staphylococcus haemolyticus]MCI2942555.1 hypothetical protein [Staphylococcus haemolyticus]MCI2944892.1 hypothetical protein [Staphylococcus haemolyticus]